jgi:autotransporter-associated beta strand protein
MILTDSSAAYIGANTNNVDAINFTTTNFRYFHIYPGLVSYNRSISGTTGLVKTGGGRLQTGQIFNYTGQTQINDGDIEISSASVLNGVISGAGSLRKTGTTTLTIGGSNTYSGGTLSVPSSATGIITFAQNNAFGTGLFTSAGPSQIVCTATSTLSNDFQINAAQSLQFRVNVATVILTISGNIAGSGSISKTSTGQLRLNGTLTYTGSTTISAGTLRAIKTTGASTATATFPVQGNPLSVSFNVAPPSGTTAFRFFQGSTAQTYASVTLTGVPVGTTATYASATSTLSVTVP